MNQQIIYDEREYGFHASSSYEISDRAIFLDVGSCFEEGVIDHHHIDSTNPQYAELTSTARMIKTLLLGNPASSPWPGAAMTRERIERFRKDGAPVTFVLHRNPDLDSLFSAFVLEKYIRTVDFELVARRLLEDGSLFPLIDMADRGKYDDPGFRDEGNLYFVLEAIKADVFEKNPDQGGPKVWEHVRRDFFAFLDDFLNGDESITSLGAKWGAVVRSTHIMNEVYEACKSSQTDVLCPMFVKEDSKLRISKGTVFWIRMTRELAPRFNLLKVIYRSQDPSCIWIVHSPPNLNPPFNRHRLVLSVDGNQEMALFGYGWHLEVLEKKFREQMQTDPKSPSAIAYPPIPKVPPRPHYPSLDPWYDGRNQNFTIVDSPNAGTILGELHRSEVFEVLQKALPEEWQGLVLPGNGKECGGTVERPVILPLMHMLASSHSRWSRSLVDAVIDYLHRQALSLGPEPNLKNDEEIVGLFTAPAQIVDAIRRYLPPDDPSRARLESHVQALPKIIRPVGRLFEETQ